MADTVKSSFHSVESSAVGRVLPSVLRGTVIGYRLPPGAGKGLSKGLSLKAVQMPTGGTLLCMASFAQLYICEVHVIVVCSCG